MAGAVGVVFAVLIVIGEKKFGTLRKNISCSCCAAALVVVVVYFLKKRNLIVLSVKKPESPTVSFENPFYTSTREPATNLQVTNYY